MVSIVVFLDDSKGMFTEDTINGTFRLSFLKKMNPNLHLAYRLRYLEYEKQVMMQVGLWSKLNENMTVKASLDEKFICRLNLQGKFWKKIAVSVCPQVLNAF